MRIHASKEEAARELKAVAPQLDDRSADFLSDMYSTTHLTGTDRDGPVALNASTRTSIVQGSELNKLARAIGARRSLEVGLAYGFSTIWLLDAVLQQPDGQHIAMDPYQQQTWHGIGLQQAMHFCVPQDAFAWIPEPSIEALVKMAQTEDRIDIAYIDGNHRYDNVLIDFFLIDRILRVGGIVAFDDRWMPSIRTATSFVETNRAYRAVPHKARNMIAFEKLADDDRDWDHFVPFEMHRSHRLVRRSVAFAIEYLQRKIRR
jgi:predicted O-methyltransferase YrrM